MSTFVTYKRLFPTVTFLAFFTAYDSARGLPSSTEVLSSRSSTEKLLNDVEAPANSNLFAQAKSNSKTDSNEDSNKETNGEPKKKEWHPNYIPMDHYEKQSPLSIAYMDLLIPGYGMYQLERYYWALSYASLKLMGAALIFFSVQNYLFWKPIANQFATDELLSSSEPISLDNGNIYMKPLDIRNTSDTALLWLTFSVIFEVLVYGISFWHTLNFASYGTYDGKEEEFYEINIEECLGKRDGTNQLHFKFGYKWQLSLF